MNKIPDISPDGESLEKEAPLLHSISKENPFSVPENYFDSLPSHIIERCREEKDASQWTVFLGNLRLYILGYKWKALTITGCIAIICFFTIHFNSRPVSYEALAQNIPDSLIVQHLDKNINDINLSTLEDMSAEASYGQEQNTTSSPTKNVSDSANTDQDIIAYLINHNVTVSDIENEP